MSGQSWRRWVPTQEKRYAVVVMTEEHLPEKWRREVEQTVPLSYVSVARRPGEITAFVRGTTQVSRTTLCVLIIPKSMAKLGSGWTGAWNWRLYHGRKFYACPHCGEFCKEQDEAGQPTYPVSEAEWFQERKRRCHNCGEPLWQMVRLKDNEPYFPPSERTLFGQLRNPPPVRYPLGEFILRQYRGFFDLAIIDEAHRYNAEATDQVYAYRALVKAVRQGVIEATASTFNGRASSLFTRLHTLNRKVRGQFAWTERQDFTALYGKLERRMKEEDEDDGYGHFTGRRRRRTTVKELPAVSPALAPVLLPTHVFLNLDDLGAALPDYREECIPLDMPSEMAEVYQEFDQNCLAAVKTHPRIVGAWLQASLAWPNAPWNVETVWNVFRDESGQPLIDETTGEAERELIATTTALGQICSPELWPKEAWLLEAIRADVRQGRGVGVYLQHIHERGLPERLHWLCAQAGIRAAILPETVATHRREAWLKAQVSKGAQVLITHPAKVETGLDLYAFPTLVFYQIPYSLTQLTQGKGRAWRLGQTQDCRVLFPYYRQAMEHRALSLMADKTKADKILTGNEAAGALVEESTSDGDFLAELARQAIAGAAVDDLGVLLVRQQKDAWITAGDEDEPEERVTWSELTPITHAMQLSLFA